MSPEDESADPRAHPRVEASFHVHYKTVDELVLAYSADLSRGGMFLATEKLLPLNAVVQVGLKLPDGAGEIPVICRVVFLRDAATAAAQQLPAGMGVEFLDLDGEALQLLEHFIVALSGDAEPHQRPLDRHLKVLVVDDDPAHREAIAQPFRERGDTVLPAPDGFEALALALQQLPDVILCDVQMPRMDGWQFLRMVRARPSLSSIPMVFLTTLSGDDERLRGYQLGVDDFIAKPFSAAEVRTRVNQLVMRMHRSTRPAIEKKTLRGDLALVSLASVLSFLENEHKTGELLILGPSRARLLLRDGKLLRCELSEPLPPAERIFAVLGWRRGQFEFAAQEVDGDGEGTSLTALILEHAHRIDEGKR